MYDLVRYSDPVTDRVRFISIPATEDERRARMVEEIKIKLVDLSYPDMCVLRLTYKFILYMHNVTLLREFRRVGEET